MSRSTQVDVAICTWNRSALLQQTLESISKLEIADDVELRLIVVNNNSTDATADVLERFGQSQFAQRHKFVSLVEADQGHTFSRNCAVCFLREELKENGTEPGENDLVVWTDDDVIVAPDWITKYVAAAKENSGFDFFGSVIEPKFAIKPPSWIEENWDTVKGCFAHRDLGIEPIEFTKTRLPYGANFAIRTRVQKAFEFDVLLGRRGESVMGEDELDLMRRMLDGGHAGVWVPGAVVEHVIPADRMGETYVYDYFVGQGAAVLAKGESQFANLKEMQREAKRQYWLYKLKRPFVASPNWMAHMVRSALAKGQADSSK